MITHPAATVSAAQAGVDAHNTAYTFRLYPDKVILRTLPHYGFKSPTLVSPARPVPSTTGRPLRKAEVKDGGKLFKVFVAQVGRHGPTGVWFIVTILPQRFVTGGIGHPAAVVRKIQSGADTGRKNYKLFLDPDKVLVKELPQYGFVPPFKVDARAVPVASTNGRPLDVAVVTFQGVVYNIYLSQPARRGARGIWLIADIEPRT